MRPTTLAEACRRAQAGDAFDVAIGEFLQSCYLAPSIEARVPKLADEPPAFEDRRYGALVGGLPPSSRAEGVAIQRPLGSGVWRWIASLRSR